MNHIEILSFLFILSIYSSINNAHAHLEGEGIIGGKESNPGEYTYQVSLQKRFQNFCGGTIIGDRHVVTAAHCVTDKNGVILLEPIKVVAGVNNLKNKGDPKRVEIDVKKVYIPKIYKTIESWSTKLYQPIRSIGDIAVLKLDRRFNFKSHPHLSKLKLGDPSESYAGKTAVVTGFGWNYVFTRTNDDNVVEELTGISYDRSRSAQTTVLSNEDCSKLFASHNGNLVSESHLCARVVQPKKGLPEGVCTGDSGGPLAYGGDTLIGVLSTSPNGCKENIIPAVYTRVSSYLDFIQKAVNNVNDAHILSTPIIMYCRGESIHKPCVISK